MKKADFGIDLHVGMKGHLLLPHARARKFKKFLPSLEYYQALGTEIVYYHEGAEGMLNVASIKENIPIVCFEIGEADRLNEYYINEGVKAIKNFMKYFWNDGRIARNPEKQLLLKNNVEIRATKGGIFYPKIKIGSIVNKNDIIGYIRK